MDDPPCEIAIQTIIGPELTAMLGALGIKESDAVYREGNTFYHKKVHSEADSRDISVIVHCQGEAGNAASSAAATRLIEQFHPRLMILTGIAAGRREKVKIGDVAVPRVVMDKTLTYATERGVELRPTIPMVPHIVGQLLKPFDPHRCGWHELFHRLFGKAITIPHGEEANYAENVATAPRLHDVALASDDVLIRDPQILANDAKIHQHVYVGEMESAGFARACESRHPTVPWLIVRGVSDFGDSFKNDDFHRLASVAAASYVATLLRHGFRIGLFSPGAAASEDDHEPDWISSMSAVQSELDRHFAGHARVLGFAREDPELIEVDEFRASDAIRDEAKEYRGRLHASGYPNDSHGLLAGETHWSDYPLVLNYQKTDFATIMALRRAGKKPRALSASGVIVVPTRRVLLLHRRDEWAATYPGRIHTIGGAFAPAFKHSPSDRSLRDTLLREIHEEAYQWLANADWPAVMVEETTTGFVQYVALGVHAPSFRLATTWEGRTLEIAFDKLESVLMSQDWVPSGKLHVLLWLAAGAPGCPNARFGGHDATSLLETVLRRPGVTYDVLSAQGAHPILDTK